MAGVDRSAPAVLWRVLFIALVLPAARSFAAPAMNPAPELSQAGKPTAVEAARILEQFRQAGIPGQYFLDFELRALPRRGDEQVFNGRLWGGRNAQGAINRIELIDAAGGQHRLIVQNGERAAVWHLAGGRVVPLGNDDLFAPVIPGVDVTVFDLQMPYLYWPDATLESIKRVLGRPAHAFLFRAPEKSPAERAGIAAARVYLDTQSNQLLKTELVGTRGRVLKTFSLGSLKIVDRQPLPKAFDFLNDTTRDKTRLQVRGVALHLEFAPSVFEPDSLVEGGPMPPKDRVVRLEP